MKRGYWLIIAATAILLGIVIIQMASSARAEDPQGDFSVAVINDLHIGEGSKDYGGTGYNDKGTGGEEHSATQNLRAALDQIKANKDNYNIKYLFVVGDITDSGEYSEFEKAKQILDQFQQETGITYVPVLGNHDAWPYTVKWSINLPFGVGVQIPSKEAATACGDQYFQEIFKGQFDKLSTMSNWQKDASKFQNFAFDYNGYHFICLDFNTREAALLGPGTKPEADISSETWQWFINHLDGYISQNPNAKVVIFQHHPLQVDFFGANCFSSGEVNKYLHNYIYSKGYDKNILGIVVGHNHENEVKKLDGKILQVQTDACKDTGTARVIQFKSGQVDFGTTIDSSGRVSTNSAAVTTTTTDIQDSSTKYDYSYYKYDYYYCYDPTDAYQYYYYNYYYDYGSYGYYYFYYYDYYTYENSYYYYYDYPEYYSYDYYYYYAYDPNDIYAYGYYYDYLDTSYSYDYYYDYYYNYDTYASSSSYDYNYDYDNYYYDDYSYSYDYYSSYDYSYYDTYSYDYSSYSSYDYSYYDYSYYDYSYSYDYSSYYSYDYSYYADSYSYDSYDYSYCDYSYYDYSYYDYSYSYDYYSYDYSYCDYWY